MSVLATRFRIGGTNNGMPVILEEGECTGDSTTTNGLKTYETGRVEILPLPRAAGLVAKGLDAALPTLQTVGDAQCGGARANCLQIGKTEFSQIAPEQPFGLHSGEKILAYRRVWQQLSVGS
jgi:hypothetical protein